MELEDHNMGLLGIVKNEFNKKSLFNEGNKHLEKGELDKAQKCYDKILKLDSSSVNAWYNKGLIFFKIKKYMESIEFFDNALDLEPGNIKALIYKGLALGSINKYEKSYACFDKALKLNPKNAETWYGKGIVLGKNGKYPEAIEHFDKALELNPDFKSAKDSKKLIKSINLRS